MEKLAKAREAAQASVTTLSQVEALVLQISQQHRPSLGGEGRGREALPGRRAQAAPAVRAA
ncbi:hypothetical protein ACIP4Y_32615 [Streptomyces sp. NPDC088810]|uniref:hypothetical protein n=1 Tax=Streptomyces sp. NPDC088810 TaxID=3365904 RepID=UPI0038296274